MLSNQSGRVDMDTCVPPAARGLNIPSGKESEDLPYLYWIPKLHKTPYKERYIAGSSTCSTKGLARISSLSNEVGLYVVCGNTETWIRKYLTQFFAALFLNHYPFEDRFC
jgi:hypothetical protein